MIDTNNELSYARKYRPATWSHFIGADVKELIWNRFSEGQLLPQAILIHGEPGCGKTTLTRLLAKEYHCTNKIDGHACGECVTCKAIDDHVIRNGHEIMGVQELDIAQDSGKADIEDILADAIYPPVPPLRYKVLIFDECHMASVHAQNRLLKIVEEPPAHLIFMFCTTRSDKLLDTLRSRCTCKIPIQKPTQEELLERLLYIAQSEKLTVSKQSLTALIRANKQVPRDTISMLEEIANAHANVVDLRTVAQTVGKIANSLYAEFYKASNSSIPDILLFIKRLGKEGVNPKQFIEGLTRFSMDCLYLKNGLSIDEYSKEQAKALAELYKIYDDSQIDCLLQILEYASIHVNDVTNTDLLLLTTGIRISKLPHLFDDLSGERDMAEIENQKSYNAYMANKKAEEASKPVEVKKANMSDGLMAAVFGKKVVNVGQPVKIDQGKPQVNLDPTQIIPTIDATVDTETMVKKILGE